MFRRNVCRMGHQLIQEPLGNEHHTLARGQRTFHNLMHELNLFAAVSAAGIALATFTVASSYAREVECIGTPPAVATKVAPAQAPNAEGAAHH